VNLSILAFTRLAGSELASTGPFAGEHCPAGIKHVAIIAGREIAEVRGTKRHRT
jgi:hypothetical protein